MSDRVSRSRYLRYEQRQLHILAETGTDVERCVMVTPPGLSYTLLRWIFVADSDYTSNGSNYWTISLELHDRTGAVLYTIPETTFDLDENDIATDGDVTLPVIGEFGFQVPPDHEVVVNVNESGTGAGTLSGTLFLDVLKGV